MKILTEQQQLNKESFMEKEKSAPSLLAPTLVMANGYIIKIFISLFGGPEAEQTIRGADSLFNIGFFWFVINGLIGINKSTKSKN